MVFPLLARGRLVGLGAALRCSELYSAAGVPATPNDSPLSGRDFLVSEGPGWEHPAVDSRGA